MLSGSVAPLSAMGGSLSVVVGVAGWLYYPPPSMATCHVVAPVAVCWRWLSAHVPTLIARGSGVRLGWALPMPPP